MYIKPAPKREPRDLTDLEIHILATALAIEAIGLRAVRVRVIPTIK